MAAHQGGHQGGLRYRISFATKPKTMWTKSNQFIERRSLFCADSEP